MRYFQGQFRLNSKRIVQTALQTTPQAAPQIVLQAASQMDRDLFDIWILIFTSKIQKIKYEHGIVKKTIRDVNNAIIKTRKFLRSHLKRIPNESSLAFQNDYHATIPMATTLMATPPIPDILYTLHYNGKLLNHTPTFDKLPNHTPLGYEKVIKAWSGVERGSHLPDKFLNGASRTLTLTTDSALK